MNSLNSYLNHPGTFFWWWMGIGTALWVLVLIGSLKLPPRRAYDVGAAGLIVSLFAWMPLVVIGSWDWMIFDCVAITLLAMTPLIIGSQRWNRSRQQERDLVRQQASDEAEGWIQRFGA